jgi:hypothetical protein
MKNNNLSITRMARYMGQPIACSCTMGRFLQKAHRNSAAVIIYSRINSL